MFFYLTINNLLNYFHYNHFNGTYSWPNEPENYKLFFQTCICTVICGLVLKVVVHCIYKLLDFGHGILGNIPNNNHCIQL